MEEDGNDVGNLNPLLSIMPQLPFTHDDDTQRISNETKNSVELSSVVVDMSVQPVGQRTYSSKTIKDKKTELDKAETHQNVQTQLQSLQHEFIFKRRQLELFLFTQLHEMRCLSDDWRFNHSVRLVTGSIIGCLVLILIFNVSISNDYIHLITYDISVVMYVLMFLITCIYAGYVNDEYFDQVLQQLIQITHQLTKQENAINQCNEEPTAAGDLLPSSRVTIASMLSNNGNNDPVGQHDHAVLSNTVLSGSVTNTFILYHATQMMRQEVSKTITKLTAMRGMNGLHMTGLFISMDTALGTGSFVVTMLIFLVGFLVYGIV